MLFYALTLLGFICQQNQEEKITPTDTEDDFITQIETKGHEEYTSNVLQDFPKLFTQNEAILTKLRL